MSRESNKSCPWISKSAVNRAGEALRGSADITHGQASVLEAWRIAHKHVINTFQALLRARAKDTDIQVAQRLKRRSTIVDKLSRYPGMLLARMDDVAGCRVIFQNINALKEFRDGIHHARFKHVRKNETDKYDYLTRPTSRGYRGIHDIYEYRARSKGPTTWNGLLIEIQYRTQVQHAWATSVEVVTQLTENEPKFNRGDERHIRFFCLASEILARAHENLNSCAPDLTDRNLIDEFDRLDGEIGVMKLLLNLRAYKWIDDQAKSKHVILHLKKSGDFQMHQYDLELEASRALLDLEKSHPEDDVVLVGADSVAEITSAFRNYFSDVGDFLVLMSDARVSLAGDVGKSPSVPR